MPVDLESQVAKIELGPEKNDASSFVYVSAERLPVEAENFMVAEILEPDVKLRTSCQQIVLSIQAAVKRAFRKNATDETFETAVALVNEELGKLASLGQTHWIDKINCVIGVRIGQLFSLATTGKIAAYLLRDGELTDLACSSPQAHPLKTFENFASGKLKLGDILILSTSQLFNHISIDRLKRLLRQADFLKATGQIIELLKANAADDVAFGTLLVLESKAGSAPAQEINLEEYIQSAKPSAPGFLAGAWQFLASMLMPGGGIRPAGPKKPGLTARLRDFGQALKNLGLKSQGLWRALTQGVKFGRENLAPSQIKQFSPQKKFFFFSVLILLSAMVLQISVAVYKKNRQAERNKTLSALAQAKKNLSDADAALLYKDETVAKEFYLKALGGLPKLSAAEAGQFSELKQQADEMKAKLEKTVDAATENLGTLAAAGNLISLPEYLAVQSGSGIVSFNKSTHAVRDDELKSPIKIESAESVGKNQAAIYDGSALRLWDYSKGLSGPAFTQSVPPKASAVGFKLYPTNARVYMLDKVKNQIFSFAVLGDKLGKPQTAINLNADEAKNAKDLAIDGSVYVLTGNNIKKYHSGKPDSFGPVALLTPLNNPKKISAKVDFQNLYILDAGNKRLVVLNKKGNLVRVLTSKNFTDLQDFSVDEKNKTIYVLNGSSLLKVAMP